LNGGGGGGKEKQRGEREKERREKETYVQAKLSTLHSDGGREEAVQL